MKNLIHSLCLAGVLCSFLCLENVFSEDGVQEESAAISNQPVRQAAEKAVPAAVVIKPEETFAPASIGSGVIVDPDGWIITNAHVLEGKGKFYVQLEDGRLFDSKRILYDKTSDIGLIKIETDKPLPFMNFGSSDDLQLGESVLTVGSPFSLGTSVSCGIVSGKYRAHPGAHRCDMIQTDALINPGNSGGALVNLKGELVGITTSRFAIREMPQGIGFAIPSSVAQWAFNQLKDKGKVERKRLGMEVTNVTAAEIKRRNLPMKTALRVVSVIKDSSAEKAGIKVNDIILDAQLDGQTGLHPDLGDRIARLPDGAKVHFSLHRAETPADAIQSVEIPVEKIADFKEKPEHEHLRPTPDDQELIIPGAGMTVILESGSKPFAAIVDVQPGSVADDCGLKPGMNIMSWNGTELKNIETLVRAIASSCITCGQVLSVKVNGAEKKVILKKFNTDI